VTPRLLNVSTRNTAFQHIDVLIRNRNKRHRAAEFVVEGVRPINGAIAAGWKIRAFAHPRDRQLSRWALSILERSIADEHLEIAPELFAELSEKDEPSELIAIVAQPENDVERIPIRAGMLVVVVDRPTNPGNLGTIIRSCDAFGADGVIVTGHAVDLYDPAVIRASVGALFAIPCVTLASHREVAAWLNDVRASYQGLTFVGTSARATHSLREFQWGSEVVLAIGNETAGLSHSYRELCDAMVGMPMRGTATSLNAAVAASIALYEVDAHRRASEREANLASSASTRRSNS
jgi:TrmH family RNA methyltransferase